MSEGPIATTYVEIRPLPDSKQQMRKDVTDVAAEAGRAGGDAMGKGIGDGAKKGRTATEEQLRILDERMVRTQALADTVGKGIGRAFVRGGQLAAGAFAVGIVQARRSGEAVSQLESALKSTGGTAGLTEQQMRKLADTIEGYSGQGAESVVAAEAQLLAYKRLHDEVGAGNDVFTRATKATADMAQRMGTDGVNNAKILGRALNDPVHGLSALITAGIDFDAQQIKTIRRLEETGQHLAAQKLILDQVEQTVGGAAQAYGQTLPGALDRAKVSFENHAAGLVKFVDDHQVLSGTLAGTAASLYITVKAVRAYKEIRDVLMAGSAKRIAANLAEARSVDAITAAEARAGGASVARGRGGIAGRIGAGGGLLGAIGAGPAAIGAGAIAVGLAGIHSIGTVKTNQRVQQLHEDLERAGASRAQLDEYELSLRDKLLGFDKDHLRKGQELLKTLQSRQVADQHTSAVGQQIAGLEQRVARSQGAVRAAEAARLDPNTLNRSGVLGGVFDELPSRSTGDIPEAREQLREANRQIREAQRALTEARAGGAGASRSSIASAEASVLSARDAITKRGGNSQAEQLRLEAAEARLADLRSKGGANADKVREAEDKLAEARRTAAKASKDLHEAEKGTALSVDDVLKRLGGQTKNAQTLVADSGLLIKAGVSKPVLEALNELEKTAPGTLDKVAKSITPAMAKALNAQQAELTRVQFQFYDAPRVAALRQAEAAAKADTAKLNAAVVKAQREAYRRALDQGLFSDETPAPATPRAAAADAAGTDDVDRAHPIPTSAPAKPLAVKQTTINMPNAVIVANDSKALFDEMDKRARRDALR